MSLQLVESAAAELQSSSADALKAPGKERSIAMRRAEQAQAGAPAAPEAKVAADFNKAKRYRKFLRLLNSPSMRSAVANLLY